jgi:hypothetical protein
VQAISSAQVALHRNAGASPTVTPPTKTQSLSDNAGACADFAHTLDGMSLIVARDGLPTELRAFADAVIGIAGGRDEWIDAGDELLAERMNCSTKTVQRYRKDFIIYQEQQKVIWIEIQDNYRDSATGKNYPHKYRAHLHKAAVAVVANARRSPEWNINPGVALREGMRGVKAPNVDKAHRSRGRKRELDAETVINKNLKTAATLIRKAQKLLDGIELKRLARGGAILFQPDAELVADVQQAAASLSNDIGTKPVDNLSSGFQGGESPNNLEDTSDTAYRLSDVSSKPNPPAPTRPVEPIAPPEIPEESSIDDALVALDVFASVGVTDFKVLFKDDVAKSVDVVDAHATLASVVRSMPDYLARSDARGESFILDMKANGRWLIQVDEANGEVQRLLADVAFATLQTSDGNGQSFLAFRSEREALAANERLFATLRPLGANRGASGGLRWIGSHNFKPERIRDDGTHPRVRLLAYHRGRFTSADALDALGLLGDIEQPKPEPRPALIARTNAGRLPSYAKATADTRRKENDEIDRSAVDFHFACVALSWGRSESETIDAINRHSSKARERRDNYAEKIVSKAMDRVTTSH